MCVKIYTRSLTKPNSDVRKVSKVKLSTGYKVESYIPEEENNLQQYFVVLVRGGKTLDLPVLDIKKNMTFLGVKTEKLLN